MNKLVKLLWPYLRKVQPWTLPSWVADCAWYLLYVLHQHLGELETSQAERFWIVDFWGDFSALADSSMSFNNRAWHVVNGLRAAPDTLQPIIAAFELAARSEDRPGNVEPLHAVRAVEALLEVARDFGDEPFYQQILGWATQHLAGHEDGSSYLDDFRLLRVYNEEEQAEPVHRRLMAPDGSDALEIFDEEEFDELWQQGFESEEGGEDHAHRL